MIVFVVVLIDDFRAHLFGISGLSNHMPAFGSIFSVTAFRTSRVRMPRHFTLGLDLGRLQQQQELALTGSVEVPKEEDPAVWMNHASAVTTVTADAGVRYVSVNLLTHSSVYTD